MSINDWMLPNSSDARQKVANIYNTRANTQAQLASAEGQRIANQDAQLELARKVQGKKLFDQKLANEESQAAIQGRKLQSLKKYWTPETSDYITNNQVQTDMLASDAQAMTQKSVVASQLLMKAGINGFTDSGAPMVYEQLKKIDPQLAAAWKSAPDAKSRQQLARGMRNLSAYNVSQAQALQTQEQSHVFDLERDEKATLNQYKKEAALQEDSYYHQMQQLQMELAVRREVAAKQNAGQMPKMKDISSVYSQEETAQFVLDDLRINMAAHPMVADSTFEEGDEGFSKLSAMSRDISKVMREIVESDYNNGKVTYPMEALQRAKTQVFARTLNDGEVVNANDPRLQKEFNEFAVTAAKDVQMSPTYQQVRTAMLYGPEAQAIPESQREEWVQEELNDYVASQVQMMWTNPMSRGWTTAPNKERSGLDRAKLWVTSGDQYDNNKPPFKGW